MQKDTTNKILAVVVVTYNSESHIFDCLQALFANNDIGDRLEVIVVDNCSKQGEAMFRQIGAAYGDRVILVKNDRNGGYGQGNNVGIRRSTAPFIAIMNPDVRLIQPVFLKALEGFQENENVVMYGIKQMRTPIKPGYSFHVYETTPVLLQFFLNAACNAFDWYFDKHMSLQGSFFFVRKQPFMDIGMFDENLFMYAEEEDIHRRLMGIPAYRCLYNKRLKYLHLIDRRPLTPAMMERRWESFLRVQEKCHRPADLYLRREYARLRLLYLFSFLKGQRGVERREYLRQCLGLLRNKVMESAACNPIAPATGGGPSTRFSAGRPLAGVEPDASKIAYPDRKRPNNSLKSSHSK